MLVFGSLNCLDWSLLTPATKEMLALAEQVKGRFQGDPSFEYSLSEINAEAAARLMKSGKEVNAAKRFRTVFTTFAPLTLDRWWLLLVCKEQHEHVVR